MGRFNWMLRVIRKTSAVGVVAACAILGAPEEARAITVTGPSIANRSLMDCEIMVEAWPSARVSIALLNAAQEQ